MRILISVILTITMCGCLAKDNDTQSEHNGNSTDWTNRTTTEDLYTKLYNFDLNTLFSNLQPITYRDFQFSERDELGRDSILKNKMRAIRRHIPPQLFKITSESAFFYLYYTDIYNSSSNPINVRILEVDKIGNMYEYYGGRHKVEYYIDENTLTLLNVDNLEPQNADFYSFKRLSGMVEDELEGLWETETTYFEGEREYKVKLGIVKYLPSDDAFILSFNSSDAIGGSFDGSLIIEKGVDGKYYSDFSSLYPYFSEYDKHLKTRFVYLYDPNTTGLFAHPEKDIDNLIQHHIVNKKDLIFTIQMDYFFPEFYFNRNDPLPIANQEIIDLLWCRPFSWTE